MYKYIDITGQRFGRITVVSLHEINKNRTASWNCLCDCGVKRVIIGTSLRKGVTVSCGCYNKEINVVKSTIHGKYKTPSYVSWDKMIQRCCNPNCNEFNDYGGRGILVCDKWKSFEGFYEDMGERPTKTSIERIDTNKGYTKDNCIWAGSKVQGNNTRRNKFIEYKGKVQTIAQWAVEFGIKYDTLFYRLFIYEWSIEDSLNIIPSKHNCKQFGKDPVTIVRNPNMSLSKKEFSEIFD